MKVIHHFEDIHGRTVMPGETFNADGYDQAEIDDLQERGYIDEGDGFEAGKEDWDKMDATTLRAYGRAMGIDVTSYSTRALRARVRGAVDAQRMGAAAPGGEQKAAVVTFGGKNVETKIEEVTIAPKEGQTTAEAVKEAQAAPSGEPGPSATPKSPEAPTPAPAPQKTASRGGAERNPVA